MGIDTAPLPQHDMTCTPSTKCGLVLETDFSPTGSRIVGNPEIAQKRLLKLAVLRRLFAAIAWRRNPAFSAARAMVVDTLLVTSAISYLRTNRYRLAVPPVHFLMLTCAVGHSDSGGRSCQDRSVS